MEDVARMSDRELLGELIGQAAASRIQKGALLRTLQAKTSHTEVRALHVARELFERMYLAELAGRPVFAVPEAVKGYFSMVYMTKPYEVFIVLFLDVHLRLIAAEEMFRGTLTQTSVYPREVVVRALELRAASVILSHNHPSGSTQPSRADEMLTQTLKQALSLVDVRVMDHVIWASGESLSMAERGLL
jgi:DNA repair protein RadC